MSRYITHTAYDEDPDCMRCINVNSDDDFCVNECGAEHAWCGYRRLEEVEDEGRRTCVI